MGNNNIRKGYLARAKDGKIVYRPKEEMKRQLQNCFEVIREYEEKEKTNQNSNSSPNSVFSSNTGRNGHERVIGVRRNEERQIEKKKNNEHRTVSSMLGDIKYLTPEERSRAGGMLDVLEQNKGHNRGRGRE